MIGFATSSYADSNQYKFTVAVIQTLDNLDYISKTKNLTIQNSLESFKSKKISFNEFAIEGNKAAYIYKNDLKSVDDTLKPFLSDSDATIQEISKTIIDNVDSLGQVNDEGIKIANDSVASGQIDANASGKMEADYQINIENIQNAIHKVNNVLGLQVGDEVTANDSNFIISNDERTKLLKMIDDKFGDAVEDMKQVMFHEKDNVGSEFKYDEWRIIQSITYLDISLMFNKLRKLGINDSHYYAVVKNETDFGSGYGKNITESIGQTETQEECQRKLEEIKKGQNDIVSAECVPSNGRLNSIFNNEPIGRWYARMVTQVKTVNNAFEFATVFDSRDIMKLLANSGDPVELIGNNYFKNKGKAVDAQVIDKDYIVSPYGEVTTYYDSTKSTN